MPLPLAKINELRARHHAEPLTEDPELTKAAQQWADYLRHNGQFRHSRHSREKGEILAISRSAEQAVDMWYEEVELFDWNSPRFTGATAHFSALVWADSRRIGWGEADDGSEWTLFVAHLTPPGNVTGADSFRRNVLRS